MWVEHQPWCQQTERQSAAGCRATRGIKGRTRPFLLFVVLPAWLVPGLLDWWCHRRTHIEQPENGGVVESLVHSTMFAEAGMPLVLSAYFEMNPLVITLMVSSAVLHELTAMADVNLALKSRRHVSQWEQHAHSFLEVMPFWMVPLMVVLHEPIASRWSLVRRSSALSRRDWAVIAAAVVVGGALPYLEELVRCLKFAPTPADPAPMSASNQRS